MTQRTQIDNRAIYREELREIKEIFDANNTEFFLLFGTCLGAVREQNIILWDGDIDIGVLDSTSVSKIRKMFINRGFVFRRLPQHWQLRKRISHTDIVWFVRRGDKIVSLRTTNAVAFSVPARFFNDLEKVKIGNDEYLAPCPVEGYLNVVYGSDWSKPDKHKRGVTIT